MKQFTDAENRTWDVVIRIAEAKRLGDALGLDLFKLGEGDPPLLVRLNTDPMLIGSRFWSAVRGAPSTRMTASQSRPRNGRPASSCRV